MASLSDVVKGIQSTNELLVENVKGQNRTAAMITAFVTGQQSSFGDRLEAGREKGKSTKATAQPVRGSSGGGFKSGFMKGSGLGSLLGIGSKIIGAIFAGAAGATLLASIAGIISGKIVLGAAAIGLIRTFGAGAVNKILEMLDPNNLFFDSVQKAAISQSFTTNLQFGLLAFLINKKFGVAVFLGLMLKDLAMSMLGDKGRENMKKAIFDTEFENEFLQKFVDNFTGENLAAVGGVIASFFGLSAITKGLMWAFTGKMISAGGAAGAGGASVGRNAKGQFTKLRPGLKAGFLRGFGLKLGLAMMMPMLGEAIGNQISGLTGNEELGEMTKPFITATLIAGMLGGPYAALVAAIVGMTIIGFNAVKKWATEKNDKILADTLTKLELLEKKFPAQPGEQVNNQVTRQQHRALMELRRKAQLRKLNEMERKKFILLSKVGLSEDNTGSGPSRDGPGGNDFLNERTGRFFTGIPGTGGNPYEVGSEKYRMFQQLGQENFIKRIDQQKTSTFRQMMNQDPTGMQFGLLKTLQLKILSTNAERDALLRAASDMRAAARLAAQTALARENSLSTPGNTTVVVAGNQRVSTIDATTGAYAPRNYSNPYIQYGVQTTSAGGGF